MMDLRQTNQVISDQGPLKVAPSNVSGLDTAEFNPVVQRVVDELLASGALQYVGLRASAILPLITLGKEIRA